MTSTKQQYINGLQKAIEQWTETVDWHQSRIKTARKILKAKEQELELIENGQLDLWQE